MNEFGFLRFVSASVSLLLLDCSTNVEKIKTLARAADTQNAALLLTQELSLTGATCGDMFFSSALLENARAALLQLADASKNFSVLLSVGCPLTVEGTLYSTQVLISGGKILAVVPLNSELPQFRPYVGNEKNLQFLFGVDYEIRFGNFPFYCTVKNGSVSQRFSFRFVSTRELRTGVRREVTDVLLLPAALPNFAGQSLREAVQSFSRMQNSIVLFANAGSGESSGEHIFLGDCAIFENGQALAFENIFSASQKISDDSAENRAVDFTRSPLAVSDADVQLIQNRTRYGKKRVPPHYPIMQTQTAEASFPICITVKQTNDALQYAVKQNPYLPAVTNTADEENFFIAVLDYTAAALARRLSAVGTDKTVLGISGGIDSTFALLVCTRTMQLLRKPNENVYAITMPCFGTTGRTKTNAITLAKNLGCRYEIIDISKTVKSHFKDISHDYTMQDTTFENAQARERTQVLMDKANRCGGIVVSASDLSEIALGWSTFAGDHISMYNVAASVPKTVLRAALKIFANNASFFKSGNAKIFSKTIIDILQTPVSPELLPANSDNTISQKTETILGDYALHDFFIFHFVRNHFTKEKIVFLAEHAFTGVYSRLYIEKTAETFFKRFFTNQFKRSCSPEGVAVLPVSLSPRGEWTMPSDVDSAFLKNFFQ